MPILPVSELSRPPLDAMTAGSRPYPYLGLDAADFERLAAALFDQGAPKGRTKDWSLVSLMVQGSDGGRDLALFQNEALVEVVQCKRIDGALGLPSVMTEIAKTILYAAADKDLPDVKAGVRYTLVLAKDPAKTVVSFFERPSVTLAERPELVPDAVTEAIATYKTLTAAWTDKSEAQRVVGEAVSAMQFHLLRPHDLEGWLADVPAVAARFFHHRTVVDTAAIKTIEALMAQMAQHTRGVAAVTDEDVAVIVDAVTGIPASHRVNLGIANVFGLPREMFANGQLAERGQRLVEAQASLVGDYIEWLNDQAWASADAVTAYNQGRLHPFALQIPRAFLGFVVKDQLDLTLHGEMMRTVLANMSGTPTRTDDQARFRDVRQTLLQSGERYLAQDFSELEGDPGLVALKRSLIPGLLQGLATSADIEAVLDMGLTILEPDLVSQARRLRDLARYSPMFILGGVDPLKDLEGFKRLLGGLRGLDPDAPTPPA